MYTFKWNFGTPYYFLVFQKFWHTIDAFISDIDIELEVISSVVFKDIV